MFGAKAIVMFGTGCCSQPLPPELPVCSRSKYFFLVTEHFQASCSVFPTEGFLRPGTQVRQFGRKLKALDAFFVLKLDAKL